MRKFFICLLPFCAISTYAQNEPPNQQHKPLAEEYKAKDFSYLLGMKGFSNETLNMHFKLYQGYVKNTNLFLSLMQQFAKEGKLDSPEYAEIKRRFGWEFDGMRLHEFYFSNLGGMSTQLPLSDPLYQQITKDFGGFDAWKKDFIATGLLRGVGWAILYFDPFQKRLMNVWVGEHNIGHLATCNPILCMDVWEHAYLLDYGLDRKDYIKAFFDNIDWNIVKTRFTQKP